MDLGGGGINFHVEEIHPKWILLYENELLELISSKMIKSILSPIQSGSNRILKLMQREHDAEKILDVFLKMRKVNPELQLFTQIMVGFPSEDEDDFFDTLRLVEKVHFNEVTIFEYDEKENTVAMEIIPKIPRCVSKKRVETAEKYLKSRKIETFLSCPAR